MAGLNFDVVANHCPKIFALLQRKTALLVSVLWTVTDDSKWLFLLRAFAASGAQAGSTPKGGQYDEALAELIS